MIVRMQNKSRFSQEVGTVVYIVGERVANIAYGIGEQINRLASMITLRLLLKKTKADMLIVSIS